MSLQTLFDWPLDCGRHYKEVLSWQDGSAHHWLDMFADDPRDLDVQNGILGKYERMTPEALALNLNKTRASAGGESFLYAGTPMTSSVTGATYAQGSTVEQRIAGASLDWEF